MTKSPCLTAWEDLQLDKQYRRPFISLKGFNDFSERKKMKKVWITSLLFLFVAGCISRRGGSENNQLKIMSPLDKAISQAAKTDHTDDWDKAYSKCKNEEDLKRVSQKMKEVEQERLKRYISSHQEIDERTKKAISEGQYFIGMTKDSLRASWGPPESISKSGTRERWTYGFGISRMYLNFEDDKLVSVTGPGTNYLKK